jgi:hypothetical protein
VLLSFGRDGACGEEGLGYGDGPIRQGIKDLLSLFGAGRPGIAEHP